MTHEKTVYAEVCPHCGKSINHLRPVGERVLEAARVLLLPGNDTSRDVARVLGIPMHSAGMLLRRATAAGLIAKIKRVPSHTNGGAMYAYQPSQRLAAYAPFAYRQWTRNQRNKAA